MKDLSIAQLDADVKPLFRNVTGDAEIQTQKVAGTNDVYIKTRVLSWIREKVSRHFRMRTALKKRRSRLRPFHQRSATR